jgi:hypothetical protein
MTHSTTTARRTAKRSRRSLIPALALVVLALGATAGCVTPSDPRGNDSSRIDSHHAVESAPAHDQSTAVLRRTRA